MVGSRISLTIAVLCILISGVVGTALGLLAGYKGGWVDGVISRLIDGMSAFPPC